ncbi:MAG: acetamidase/formamidase family protein [Gemmatimonadaceae bacterium]
MTSPSRRLLAAVCVAALCFAPSTILSQRQPGAAAAPPGDSWLVAFPAGRDTIWIRFALRFQRDSVLGADPGGLPVRGTLRRDSVSFFLVRLPDSARVLFTGVLRDGVIRGTRFDTPRAASMPSDSAPFLALRDTVPSRAPRLHAFEPRVFHRWFSGGEPPALRIIPGDTVRTWSVDAGGRDSTGAARSRGGNPLTGPFYVEGAMPGDVIAVRLHRVRLNRDYAVAGSGVVWNAVTPGYVRGIKEVSGFNSRWKLDRARGLATLEQPTPALRSLAVPVRPMLGCVGVAPPSGQVIRTSDSGPFGGNMDYNEIREGTTVYLPVFQRGALLFVGDGHALQGDGELTGDALETSMNIEFSVELLRRHQISAPRAENDEFLMAIGISGDLSDALRRATTELSRWLEADYRLNAPELASLLGASMRYDVADLVGTQVSIVAKMPKAVLRQLERRTQ